ncbi:MAG: SCO family protein [Gammaproteobacteria bacterium]|nr:SCO family protein [Gammaproteobacteria bacterium]
MIRRPRGRWLALVAPLTTGTLLTLFASAVFAHDLTTKPSSHDEPQQRTRGSLAEHTIPAVRLMRDDGKLVSLPEEMNDGRPVVLNFIYTSCSSVCPLMSAVLAQFASKLGVERDTVHLMSISIDPEQDTVARLREYAQKFKAGPEWQHYTGTVEASLATQRAFGVDRGDKMSHPAATLLRVAPGTPWLRLDGFITADELMDQYRRLLQEHDRAVATR